MKTIKKIKFGKIVSILLIGFLIANYTESVNAQVKRQTVGVNDSKDYKSLVHYWSNTRKDNFLTASTNGKKAAEDANYRFVRQDGYVLTKASNSEGNAVPLYLYYNKTRKDYLTVASPAGIKSANSAGYVKIGIEGYVLQTVNAAYRKLYKPLWLYYNDSRKDNFTIASSTGMQTAQSGGYSKVRIEGYVRINNKIQNTKVIAKMSGPFERLKKQAQKSVVIKSKINPVSIEASNRNWKLTRNKASIEFIPFTLNDKDGNPIPPNKRVILQDGTETTAQEYINEINIVEEKLNALGHSLRLNDEQVVSRMVTESKFLDGKISTAPNSIGVFKNDLQVKKFMSLVHKVKVEDPSKNGRFQQVTLKPYSSYTKNERDNINQYNFTTKSGVVVAEKKTKKNRPFKDLRPKKVGNLSSLFEVNETNSKNWNFGNPEIFQASIDGSINYFTKIYPFEVEKKDSNKSEFRVKAISKVKGSLLGNSIDILNASGEFYAPSDLSKNMYVKVQIKAFETSLYNLNKSYPQKKSISETYARTFDKSFPIRIPLLPGIDFKGLIGSIGEVGCEFSGDIERTVAAVHAKPLIDLKVYGEGGLSLLGVVGGGVEAKLTLIKGELDLNAYTGIFNQNSEEIVAGVNYYFGYNIEILSGSLSAFGEICSPIDLPLVDDCYRKTHVLFEWTGFKDSGTIIQGGFTPIHLANIARYDEEPVFTQD
ncbi:hypothetical protein [uncultured Winogradskyella sp.]|uniref:hypothetical protein n=1 Tax=uncultured Winogradskyella sp. TaxID=395353 RepID=UPI00260DE078|nr:hypothetical protein [uncultured Winogradskyella sp.]